MTVLPAPYETALKPYGTALVELAERRDDVVCLGADLTRQTETDLFRDRFPERFFNAGMAEANLMGMAAGFARAGMTPFVNTFGVFCTRRPFDQVVMSIGYPGSSVRIVGFMPGLSSPGGPSHQAIDDMALMRVIPGMTVIDIADAGETRQVVDAIVDVDGPVYVRLKRGEIPVIFDEGHEFSLDRGVVVRPGEDVVVIAAGMMLPAALKAAEAAADADVDMAVLYLPVIKPIDRAAVIAAAESSRGIVTAENHSIVGGLGSAIAEVLAEAGVPAPLRRVGVEDRYAVAGSRPYLFKQFGLSSTRILERAWELLDRPDTPPTVTEVERETGGVFEPV